MLESVIETLEKEAIVYKNSFTGNVKSPDAVIRAYYTYSDPVLTELSRNSAYKYFNSLNILNVENKAYADPDSAGLTVYKTALKKDILAPVTMFYDPLLSAVKDNIISGLYKTKDINDIRLPEKALAFENNYPDDDEYGLFRETIIEIEFANSKKKTGIMLSQWLSNLKHSTPLPENNDEIIWIGSAGDIMPARGVDHILLNDPSGMEKIFTDTLKVLKSHTILIGNLEGAVTDSADMLDKSYNFKFSHKILKPLSAAGFNYFTITNNHSFDFKEKGFTDTLDNLKKYGIAVSGAGRTRKEASMPWSTNIGGVRINILSMADYPPESGFRGRPETEAVGNKPGILWLTDESIAEIAGFSTEESFDIICVHGGFEWRSAPSERQLELYRKLADAGADMVIGTHPHVLQPVEIYNNSVIAYSLGNFIFPGMGGMEYAEETIILSAGLLNGKIRYLDFHPVKIDGRVVSIDKSGTIAKRFGSMNRQFYLSN